MLELALFLVVAFVLYGSSIHGDWIFDDAGAILGNTDVMQGKWKPTLWGAGSASEWRGMVRASWALGVTIWGPTTFHFHAGNIILHGINSALVVQILTALGLDAVSALIGGLIFVGHPLAVSAVAYMTSRAVLLSAMFGFLAVWAVVAGWEILALPALALAMLSKEDTVILCLTLAVVAAILGSPWFAVFLPLPVGLAVWRWTAIRELLATNGKQVHGALPAKEYHPTAFAETVLRYPLWMVGMKLNNDPDIRPVRWWNVFVAIALVGVLAAVFMAGTTLLKIALALTCASPLCIYWFVVTPDPVMEYRAYVSLLGAAMLGALAAVHLPFWFVVMGLAALWIITGFRAFDFQDAKTFWLGCLRDGSGEKARVLVNLGGAYQMAFELDQARPYYERALQLNPRLWQALANLGVIAASQDRREEAAAYFEQANAVRG